MTALLATLCALVVLALVVRVAYETWWAGLSNWEKLSRLIGLWALEPADAWRLPGYRGRFILTATTIPHLLGDHDVLRPAWILRHQPTSNERIDLWPPEPDAPAKGAGPAGAEGGA